MKSYLVIFGLVIICNCSKNQDSNSTTELDNSTSINEKTYYYIMTFTIEDQRRKEINNRFQKFNVQKFETVSTYVSDVQEITTAMSITEDFKYKNLDRYEKYMLKPPTNNYIVIDRSFEIFNSYTDASKARTGIESE